MATYLPMDASYAETVAARYLSSTVSNSTRTANRPYVIAELFKAKDAKLVAIWEDPHWRMTLPVSSMDKIRSSIYEEMEEDTCLVLQHICCSTTMIMKQWRQRCASHQL